MKYRVRIPKLNVRSGPGTNYSDLGDVVQGDQIDVMDIRAGTPIQTIWLQVKGGQNDGRWVCLFENGVYYLEPV